MLKDIAKQTMNTERSKFITYLDPNNVYCWTINQYFPHSEFKWLNQKEIDKLLLNLTGCNKLKFN